MPLFSQRIEGVVGALAFGFEDDLQEASEIAGRPAFVFEPAKIFGGQIIERPAFVAAEGHRPCAKLFPVGGGLGGVHGHFYFGSRWRMSAGRDEVLIHFLAPAGSFLSHSRRMLSVWFVCIIGSEMVFTQERAASGSSMAI